tara:strand:+ start:640 stop:1209 length:570 start_codon:yes stop_codon:yes gene_type:complete
MRIIGGKLKNKKINFPKNIKTRPLKDNVRENIFNILMHSNIIDIDFESLNVLDLYAGSGSFGIECLSRGASNVIFVEKDLDALFNLKKNINNISLLKNSKIIAKDIDVFFNDQTFEYIKKFNIIFLDPPYTDKSFINYLKVIKEKDLLDKKHILIIHREVKSNDNLERYLSILENRIYGRSEIFFGKIF